MAVPGVTPLTAEENIALYDALRGNECSLSLPELQIVLEKNRRNIGAYLAAPSLDFYVFFSMRTPQQFTDAVDFSKLLTGYATFVPMDVVSDSQPDQGDLEIKMLEKCRGAVGLVSEETFGWINEISAMRAKGVAPIIVADATKYHLLRERHVFRTFDALKNPKKVMLSRVDASGHRRTDLYEIPLNSKVGLHVIKSDDAHQWRTKLDHCLREMLSPAPKVYARRRPSQYRDEPVTQYACKNCHSALYEENVWRPSSWRNDAMKKIPARSALPERSSEYD